MSKAPFPGMSGCNGGMPGRGQTALMQGISCGTKKGRTWEPDFPPLNRESRDAPALATYATPEEKVPFYTSSPIIS